MVKTALLISSASRDLHAYQILAVLGLPYITLTTLNPFSAVTALPWYLFEESLDQMVRMREEVDCVS